MDKVYNLDVEIREHQISTNVGGGTVHQNESGIV